jgi:phosphonopyruvate decarboxylase
MELILDSIKHLNFSSISGVPDSTLSKLISALDKSDLNEKVKVMPNEGSAIALAVGSFLGSGKPGLVYLQNSGLGNALNPLASLAHRDVYAIPMVLIIGWRGSITDDGKQLTDEPQHLVQGRITLQQLTDISVPYSVASDVISEFPLLLQEMYLKSLDINGPVAIVVRPGLFDKKEISPYDGNATLESREVIEKVLSICDEETIYVGSTGMISRELLQVKETYISTNHLTFLNVGAMGHASMIAKGIAFTLPNKRVICFDGDGSLAMHLGAMTVLNELNNFKLIILNNNSHDSVGGQRTSFGDLTLEPLLSFFSSGNYTRFTSIEEEEMRQRLLSTNFEIIEFLCKPRTNHKLPRPMLTPQDSKLNFMREMLKNKF